MPRKGPATKRPVEMDPVYGAHWSPSSSPRFSQDGKKQVAERIVHGGPGGHAARRAAPIPS